MLRVVSLNCNGIRSAARKGLYEWLQRVDPDVLCVQETKAQEFQLPFDAAHLSAYFSVFADARRKGYSGVGIYAKRMPDAMRVGIGWPEYDDEGRYVEVDFGSLAIGSLYVPSGTMGLERQRWKDGFLTRLEAWLAERARDGRSYVLCGDYNVAYREIDVYSPGTAVRVTGFLPHERAWMERVLGEQGWIDAFRHLHPDVPGYTWWSHFQQSFERDRGWRIDYQLVSADLRERIRTASVYRDERFSDHAPLVVEYDLQA